MKAAARATARQALVVVLVLATGIAYFWILNIGGDPEAASRPFGNLGSWDLETYFLPKFVYGTQEVLNGRLPVWNPFEFGGIPLLAAAQPAAVYPPKVLIFALFEPATAMKLFVVAHTLMAGIAFLLFAREERIGFLGVLAGVLCFALSRRLLSSVGHPVIISNMAWVPLVFLLSERVGRSATATSVALLGLVVGLQLTAGYPQLVLDTALLLALHATVRFFTGDWSLPPWRTLPVVALGFVIGALIAAVQLLPLFEFLRISGRLEIAEQVVAATAPLPATVSWLILLTNNVPGLVGFALAGASRRSIAPFAGLALCAFLALGGFRLLRHVPGFGQVRLAGTWFLLAQFFVAWLVACGVDVMVRSDNAKVPWRRSVLVLAMVVWAAGCLLASLQPEFLPAGWARWLGPPPEGHALAVSVFGVAGAGAFVVFVLHRTRPSLAGPLVGAGIVITLLAYLSALPLARAFVRFQVPDHRYRASALIPESALREGRVLSMVDVRGGFHILDRVENPLGREGSLPPPRFSALEKRLGAVVQMMRLDWNELAGRQGLLDTLDLRYLMVPRRLVGKLGGIAYEDTGYGDAARAVLRAVDPPGRAWAVYGVRVVDSAGVALDSVLSPAFDARHQVILEHPTFHSFPAHARRSPTPALVRRPSPTLTEVEVDLPEPGVLVLADSCFPGWTVEIDGRPAPLQCANYLVRGVELGAGPHRVLFRYRSTWVSWGSTLSLLALLATGAILIDAHFRRGTLVL